MKLAITCLFGASIYACGAPLFLETAEAQSVTTQYEYDALGRLIEASDSIRGDVTYSYDPAGNRQLVSSSPPFASLAPGVDDAGSGTQFVSSGAGVGIAALSPGGTTSDGGVSDLLGAEAPASREAVISPGPSQSIMFMADDLVPVPGLIADGPVTEPRNEDASSELSQILAEEAQLPESLQSLSAQKASVSGANDIAWSDVNMRKQVDEN